MQQQKSRRQTLGLLAAFVLFMAISLIYNPTAVQSQSTQNSEGVAVAPLYLPMINNRYDAALGTPLFGVQMYGNTSNTSPYYNALVGANASWLRVELSWAAAEPTSQVPPVYNWGAIDSNLAAARADQAGLNLIATVNHAPGWAAAVGTGPLNSDSREDLANFMAALVERYDGDGLDDAPGSPVVLYWEMYNEPDSNSNVNDSGFLPPVGWGDVGEEYAFMLEEVYTAVKTANPNAKVVFGGIAYDWFKSEGGKFVDSFLEDVLNAGGGDYFDVMNFHSYPAFYVNWTNNQGSGLIEKAAEIRSIMENFELEKPLIITESGWHDNNVPGPPIPGSPHIQARYVVQLFTESMAADLDIMIWWLLYDVGGAYPYNAGLVTNAAPPVEKLAYQVFQDVVAELQTAHFVRTLTTAETGNNLMEVHLFNDNVLNRSVYVAWLNRVDTTSSATLRLPVSGATIRNSITGAVSSVTDGSDGVNDGFITVTVGADPLYVEVSK